MPQLATAAEIKAVEAEVRAEVEASVEAAKTAPQPARDLLFEDIYTDQTKDFFIRACDNTVNHGTFGITK